MGVSLDVTGALDFLTGTSSKRQFKYNAEMQKRDQDWQKMMSDTAHQREVADLRKAGINPILSANGGAGGGSSAQSIGMQETPKTEVDPISAMKAFKDMKNIEQDTKTKKAEQTYYEKLAGKTQADTDATEQQIEINEPDEESAKALKWWNSTWLGKAVNVAGDVVGKISPFTAQAINYNSAKRNTTEVQNTYDAKGNFKGSKTTVKRKK